MHRLWHQRYPSSIPSGCIRREPAKDHPVRSTPPLMLAPCSATQDTPLSRSSSTSGAERACVPGNKVTSLDALRDMNDDDAVDQLADNVGMKARDSRAFHAAVGQLRRR